MWATRKWDDMTRQYTQHMGVEVEGTQLKTKTNSGQNRWGYALLAVCIIESSHIPADCTADLSRTNERTMLSSCDLYTHVPLWTANQTHHRQYLEFRTRDKRVVNVRDFVNTLNSSFAFPSEVV